MIVDIVRRIGESILGNFALSFMMLGLFETQFYVQSYIYLFHWLITRFQLFIFVFLIQFKSLNDI